MAVAYDLFLARAASGLATYGAQMLPANHNIGAAWTEGWDRILLLDNPGAATLYAFCALDEDPLVTARTRLDRLAAGVAGSGLISGAGPLQIVTVFAFPNGLQQTAFRSITRLAPSKYHPGLRPSSWVVDLVSERVFTGRRIKTREAELLRQAAAASGGIEILDADGVNTLQRQHHLRTVAFYDLMRGRQPIVTYALIAVNVVVYLSLYLYGNPESEQTLRNFGALSPLLVEQGQWWRLLTSMFLHAGIAHILFNMTSLFAIGTLAERLYGSSKFLAIYLGSGLIGSLASFGYAVATGNLNVLGVGASGAIFGVAGCLLTVRFQQSDIIPQQLRDRVSSSLLPLVLISLIFAFLTPYVDNGAHLGGLAGGMALSFVFALDKRLSGVR